MHDASVDRIQLNTLYIRKNDNQWSIILMRKTPLKAKCSESHTRLVPAIYEYWWRPRDDTRSGGADWKCLGTPHFISGEFFRFGTSLALGVWSTQFMKSWRDNPEKPTRRQCRNVEKTSGNQEDNIDPQDWVLDVVYELDDKWFRGIDFLSQATALTRWIYGSPLTDYILSPTWSEPST